VLFIEVSNFHYELLFLQAARHSAEPRILPVPTGGISPATPDIFIAANESPPPYAALIISSGNMYRLFNRFNVP